MKNKLAPMGLHHYPSVPPFHITLLPTELSAIFQYLLNQKTRSDQYPMGKLFWKEKKLLEMTTQEWESLCDGCGRCCLEKLEDPDTGEVFYTSVTCQFLDTWACRCICYKERNILMPDCLEMMPGEISAIQWLPKTCAYRRIHEGHDLSWWHPLVSGDAETVHKAGISVRHKVISATHVLPDQLEAYILDTEI